MVSSKLWFTGVIINEEGKLGMIQRASRTSGWKPEARIIVLRRSDSVITCFKSPGLEAGQVDCAKTFAFRSTFTFA
jgi:hypothetical protein